VWKIDGDTGEKQASLAFGPKANALVPLGPSFIDVVRDKLRLISKSLLVQLLTAFPFAPRRIRN
jgi:hypothetical protein